MNRLGRWLGVVLLLGCLARQAPARGAASFQEVYDIVRTNLTGIDEAELNHAAVEGLVSQLGSRVTLVTNAAATAGAGTPVLSRKELYDDAISYLRIGSVAQGLSDMVLAALESLIKSNQVKGIVLDLRFADGEDYPAAAATANLFVRKEQPLLDWGSGSAKSTVKWDAVTVPVAVLVNAQTTGAAEALAAVLQETGVALLIGSRTAGRASISREFTLSNGQRLRIATLPVKLGNGSTIPSSGLQPDIEVAVKPEDERQYFSDAYKEISRGTNLLASAATSGGSEGDTNRTARRRISEADLVREWRNGSNREAQMSASPANPVETDKPLVRDPALARALDLLKGLAILRQPRTR